MFRAASESFMADIRTISISLEAAMAGLRERDKVARADLGGRLSSDVTMVEEDGVRRVDWERFPEKLVLSVDDAPLIFKSFRQMDAVQSAFRMIPGSFLALLVSQFDVLVGRILRAAFAAKPELMKTIEKRLHFVEVEVEALLRKSYVEQFKWMEDRFGLVLRKDFGAWPVFVELTERRHLWVHTDGSVNRQYLTVCGREGVDIADVQVGTPLPVSPTYFREALNCITETGVKLCFIIWRKLLPDELSDADSMYNSVVYECLETPNNALAFELVSFWERYCAKFARETTRLMLLVNHCIVLRRQGKNAEVDQLLGKVDWRAKSPMFQLAERTLKRDFDACRRLMGEVGSKHDQLKASAYRDWPLFEELRKTAEFAAGFKGVFGVDFNDFILRKPSTELQQQTTDVPPSQATPAVTLSSSG